MSSKKIITLEWYEMQIAAHVGVGRTIESMRLNLDVCKFGKKNIKHRWELDIQAAMAEMASAKALGIYWSGSINNFKGADIGDFLQVRHSTDLSYNLIVRPEDKDNQAFILALGEAPTFEIIGWKWGKYAKQKKWKKAPNKRPSAWFVPQDKLKPIDELKPIIEQRIQRAKEKK